MLQYLRYEGGDACDSYQSILAEWLLLHATLRLSLSCCGKLHLACVLLLAAHCNALPASPVKSSKAAVHPEADCFLQG